jgi:hypothetical protein
MEKMSQIGTSSQFPSSFTNLTNTVGEPSKRTRFQFKPEHVTVIINYLNNILIKNLKLNLFLSLIKKILDRFFIDNQYPDLQQREDLVRQCNQARCFSGI